MSPQHAEEEICALDFFAADGTMLSAEELRGTEVVAFEINGDKLKNYALPAEKYHGDSFILAKESSFLQSFDKILIDNTAGLFEEDSWAHCEHFEALPAALPLLKNEGAITFNIVTSCRDFTAGRLLRSYQALPCNLVQVAKRILTGYYTEWTHRRTLFYGGNKLNGFSQFLEFYTRYFNQRGYEVLSTSNRRRISGLWLTTFNLRRLSHD